MKLSSNLIALKRVDFFEVLLFLYFFTLHADQLNGNLFGFTFRLNNLIGASFLIALLLRTKPSGVSLNKKILFGFCALTLVFFLSSLLGEFPGRSLVFFGWFGVTLLLYVFLPSLLFDNFPQKVVLRLYFFSFLAVGLYAFLQLFFSVFGAIDPHTQQWLTNRLVRPNAFAYEPSYYALYMTPFMVMANLSYLLKKGICLGHVCAINFLYLISASTSALFAYAIFFIVILFFQNLRKTALKHMSGAFLFLTLLAVTFPSIAKNFFLKFFFQGFMSHHSFYERWVGIVNCWKIFLAKPFLGIGVGAIPPFLYSAFSSGDPKFIFIATPEDIARSSNPLKFFEPSNVATEILGSCGILGILAFAFLLFCYCAQAKKAYKEADAERKHWILLFFVSGVVTLVVLQFNQGLFRTYIWAHLALGFALFMKRQEA